MAGLVLVERGQLDSLNALRASWVGTHRIGLIQNPGVIQTPWTLANITHATFSGYSGTVLLTSWNAAVMLGDRAITKAAPVLWMHNGGVFANWIFGYYVINGNGQLAWAEMRPGVPQLMNQAGQRYVALPQFTLGSRFPID